jgi:hypothetical protein
VATNRAAEPGPRGDGGAPGAGSTPLRTRVWRLFKNVFIISDTKNLCALACFQYVDNEYRGLEGLNGIPDDMKAREIAESVRKKSQGNPRSLTIGDAILFERMLIRLLPEASLRRKASSLRERFRRLIEPEEYQFYLESGPPDPFQGDLGQLRTDLDELLNRINYIYIISPFREEMRTRISSRISGLLLLFLVFVAIFIIYRTSNPNTKLIPALLPVVIAGAIGGFVSVQQRIQTAPTGGDAIRGVLSLYDGWFSVYLSPLTGAISATLLYLLFLGDFLKGSMFPEIDATGVAGKAIDFQAFFLTIGPKTGIEYAKLIVWAFIAGFAERLVPDTLNRLVESVETGSKAKPVAVVEARGKTPASGSGKIENVKKIASGVVDGSDAGGPPSKPV